MVKRTKHDAVFSDLVRERADFRCERCGEHLRHNPVRLHCSHIVSRKYKRLRYEPLNAVAHCASCHAYLTDRPNEFGRWVEDYLGKAASDRLTELSQVIGRFSKPQLEDIYQNMKASLQHMRQERDAGATGRIDFFSPYPD